MTDRELMQMALKFCEDIGELGGPYPYVNGTGIVYDSRKVAKALRERLAQPELDSVSTQVTEQVTTQEPVLWVVQYSNRHEFVWGKAPVFRNNFGGVLAAECFYTAPPKREWVGLTEEEIYDYADKFLYQHGSNYGIKSFAKAIEAKLKEKNT